jgi:hypothetical protein
MQLEQTIKTVGRSKRSHEHLAVGDQSHELEQRAHCEGQALEESLGEARAFPHPRLPARPPSD